MTEYCCCGCNKSVSKSFHGYCLHTGLKVFAGFCCPEREMIVKSLKTLLDLSIRSLLTMTLMEGRALLES